MPEQADNHMPEIVQERVGKAEQQINTLQWRVEKLEEWPPHIMQAQRDIEALSSNMIHLQRSQQETRDDMHHGFEAISEKFDTISDKVDQGFNDLREIVAVNRGSKSGVARGLQIALAVIAIGSAGAGAAIWYADTSRKTTANITAKCEDGTYSSSGGNGTCSGHGGVKRWLPQ